MLTREEAVSLLAAASVYDSRKPNPDAVLAWVKASEVGRWTFRDALDALHEHYAKSRDFLMPAHVYAIVQARRTAPPRPGDVPELPGPPPADREHVDRAIAELAGQLGWRRHDDPAARHAVMAVPCPWCHAPPGEPCSRPSDTARAGRARLGGFHPSRVEAAGVAR